MVVVAAVAVAALFVPAALAIRSRDRTEQEVEVQRDAAVAAAALQADDPRQAPLPRDDDYGLYDRDGALVRGRGPQPAEPALLAAFAGEPVLTVDRNQVVAAIAVAGTDPPLVIRVAEPRSEARSDTVRSIGALGLGALVIIGGAVAVAWVLASRLARPVEDLGRTAARLDDGDVTATTAPSGIAEVDQVAGTLVRTGERIQSAMRRERAFSADVSHQLRTPLTAMRTAVEAEQLDPRPDREVILTEVLGQIDRLEATLTTLLALARDTHGDRHPIDVSLVLRRAEARWSPLLAAAGRPLDLVLPADRPRPSVSPAALDHVLDVLIDNGLRHGRGRVTLGLDASHGVTRITVTDEGHLDADAVALFDRRPLGATGSGIGLHLARGLVEAEGGGLDLLEGATTAFAITLPDRS